MPVHLWESRPFGAIINNTFHHATHSTMQYKRYYATPCNSGALFIFVKCRQFIGLLNIT